MKFNNFVKSPTQFAMDNNNNKIDKNMNNLFYEYVDKINNINNDFDENPKKH